MSSVMRSDNESHYPCDHTSWIVVNGLPDQPKEELTTAIMDGEYTTSGDLQLSDWLNRDVESLLLTYEDRHYKPIINRENGMTRLQVTEIVPTGNKGVRVNNELDYSVTVKARVEHEYDDVLDEPVLFDGEVKVDGGRRVTLDNTDYYGRMQVEFEIKEVDVSGEEASRINLNQEYREETWDADVGQGSKILNIYPTRLSFDTITGSQAYCRWTGNGRFSGIWPG
ncbi:hypothetical protein BBD46_15635 [Natrialba sp. SSL1]|nr:hypothetical protein BBD46_15635 [Natrialba sp. SSL1]